MEDFSSEIKKDIAQREGNIKYWINTSLPGKEKAIQYDIEQLTKHQKEKEDLLRQIHYEEMAIKKLKGEV